MGKCGLDAGEWLPEKNKCWFANRIIKVKQKYSLSIDTAEYNSLKSVLSSCNNTNMVFYPKNDNTTLNDHLEPNNAGALTLYDDNGRGSISCSEAKKHKIAPVYKTHPAYQYMNDRDGDGVVCE